MGFPVINTLKAWLRRRLRGKVVEEMTGAYGTLREYASGVQTFTDFETGTETIITPDALEQPREWKAIATQGGSEIDVPKMTPNEAARHVAKVGGPLVYQDRAAGLIFFKPR